MKIGNIDIADMRLGTSQVSAWIGQQMAWPTEPPAPAIKYLRITSLEDGSSVQVSAVSNAPTIDLECRRVGSGTWEQYTLGTSLPIDKDEAVEFRAGPNGNAKLSNNDNVYNVITGTGKWAASGNIGTLLSADGNVAGYSSDSALGPIFRNVSALVDASKIEFPATSTQGKAKVFQSMFRDCRNLVNLPEHISVPYIGSFVFQSFAQNDSALSATVKKFDATYIETGAFYYAFPSSVRDQVIELGNVTYFGGGDGFSNCYGILDFSNCTQVPTLGSAASQWMVVITNFIVPDALYDEWITTTNWSSTWIVSKIVKHSEFYSNS